jgi:hypothetical protein
MAPARSKTTSGPVPTPKGRPQKLVKPPPPPRPPQQATQSPKAAVLQQRSARLAAAAQREVSRKNQKAASNRRKVATALAAATWKPVKAATGPRVVSTVNVQRKAAGSQRSTVGRAISALQRRLGWR